MKFQVQTVATMALVTGSAAFCPAPVAQQRPSMDLAAMNQPKKQDSMDLGKAALSFMAAAVVATSSMDALLPVEPAFAASTKATAAPVTEKVVDLKKLAPEERTKITAKKNLDLADRTLKEYSKYVTECKSNDQKAATSAKAQEKIVASAKKTVISDSDKLSAAKNQKMPQTAVKELATKSSKSKETLKVEEKKLVDLSKTASKAESELKSAKNSVKQSEGAIKTGKKKVEKAEKDYKNYTKKVQEQNKKDAEKEKKVKAAAQKALQAEEKKIKALQADQKKLQSVKESSVKEMEKKAKLLESEMKALEKMKTK